MDFLFGAFIAYRKKRLVRFLAKASIFSTPGVGALLRAMGHVPVDRIDGKESLRKAVELAEAGELVAEGAFAGLKLRLGRDRLDDDLAAIREVREAAGRDIKLMVDFNQGLPLGDAIRRCHALDDQELYWFEEPIAYDNLQGYAQLAAELDTPLQIGENFYGPRDLYKAVHARACDYAMPDLMRIGGVSGWLRSVPTAAAAGIQVSTHLYPEVAAHLMRVTETAHWLEWQDWANPILKEPFPVKDSAIQIPDVPGIGIEWDEAAIARYGY